MFIVTCGWSQKASGMIVTWLMPTTLVADRPRIVTALSIKNYTYELIQSAGSFVAHLLCDDQLELVPRFGLQSGRDSDKFDGVSHGRSTLGHPLLHGCCGHMECRVVDRLDLGDRELVVGEVIEQSLVANKNPLRKMEAITRLDSETVYRLIQKATIDGERDRALMRRY